MDNITISNIVDKITLRNIQADTLGKVAEYLKNSFGPFGSTTIIKNDGNAATYYTKDGHDILKNIKFNGVIESTVVDDLVDITKHVVKTIGDGTTSAIEMANIVFHGIIGMEINGFSSREIIQAVEDVTELISARIKVLGRPCTLDDIYNIAYTSTDGNAVLAKNIYNIYKTHGMNTYIDLEVSTSAVEDVIKSYDGMTVTAGYTDPIFVNSKDNTCRLVNPHIYIFEDPVDNGEMITLFDKIIYTNIYKAYEQNSTSEPVPTVIIAPKISNDMSAYFASIANFMMRFNGNEKPPLVILSSYYNIDEMNDIAIMCGVPTIKKYITEEAKKADIAANRAPTLENVTEFCGTCGEIVVDSERSKFIDPALRYNDDGTDHPTYVSLKSWLTTEYDKNVENGGDLKARSALRKRINSLTANLVEYYVGGVSIVDRDDNRALLEDAIKACRSAVENGVGYGANTMGLIVSHIVAEQNKDMFVELGKRTALSLVADSISDAYTYVTKMLYETANIGPVEINKIIDLTISSSNDATEMGVGPMNIRTKEHDGTVLTSITADIEALKAVTRIVTLMAVSNQFILPNPQYNVYMK